MTVHYGAQTERACENFAVSGQTLGGQTALLHAIAQVKKATSERQDRRPHRPLRDWLAAACNLRRRRGRD